MKEGKYIQRFRWITLVSGGILVILLLTAWIHSTWFSSWKKYQSDYIRLSEEFSDEQTGANSLSGIQQVSPDGLRRTDRCITCHLGIENPEMVGMPQPHAMHPDRFLDDHPVEKFGCTVCHGGQGRAVDRLQAFGQEADVHWDFPILESPYIQSSCGKCHLGIFSGRKELAGTGTFLHGQEIFNREGCLGCHKARGVGGVVGPDLTEQGEKTKHEYSFKNIQGEQTVSNWLKEHFRDPEMVSPGSDMLTMALPVEELEALVTFTMGLAKSDISYDYLGVEALQEFRGVRGSLNPDQSFSMICSACHGKKGEGKDYEKYKTGVPSIGNRDFLRVASAELIKFTMLRGRGSRQMASWLPRYSGLEMAEIDSLVNLIENRLAIVPDFQEVRKQPGKTKEGEVLYLKDCRICHGLNGSGDIGLPLNNPDFLSAASDQFLYNTLLQGRNTSGMPSWSHYSSQEMADLIAYFRAWGTGPQADGNISLPAGNAVQGELQFHFLCSRCHGEFGEGNTGPAIITSDFQTIASNAYLYETISGGRSHTAMFGWSTDVQGEGKLAPLDISNIIAYMRETGSSERTYIYAGSNPGNAAKGLSVFDNHCSECHGNEGGGLTAPALNNQEFLNAASNGYIMAAITIGRAGTRMPSWGRGTDTYPSLSASERKDLVAYIRSWQRFRLRLQVQEN